MSSKYIVSENGTDFYKCKSISVQKGSCRDSSIFSKAKSGFARLKLDRLKYCYLIELFQVNKLNNQEVISKKSPNDCFKIPAKADLVVSFTKDGVCLNNKNKKSGGDCLKIEFENINDKEEFRLYLNRCLEDPDLLDSQVSEETKDELKKTSEIIEDINSIENSLKTVKQPQSSKSKPLVSSIPFKPHSNPSTQFSMGAGISKSKFYQNSINRTDKENSTSSTTTTTASNKRRYSQSHFDENFPDSNDENTFINTINRQSLAQQQLTPKRSCINISTPPSSGGGVKWNRHSSFGKSNSGGKGFSNLGNTCYMNAILQCLLNIDLFLNDLIFTKQQINDKLTQNCLYSSLCDLYQVKELNNENMQIQALKEVKNAISQEATRFSGHQQHDAHEFLCQVLDQLKEDVDKLKKKKIKSNNNNNNNNNNENLLNEQQNQQQQQVPTIESTEIEKINEIELINPVVENFEFHVTHSIKCTQCNELIVKREEFNNLCLELPSINSFQDQQISIQDALDIFFRDENVPFNCEKCKNNNVIIKHKFKKLPRILILYLKRYQFADGNNLIKNDCSVDIPRYLTLNWLCDSQIELPNKQSGDVTGFIKEGNTLKPIPLATKELNQQQQQQQSSGLKNFDSTRPFSFKQQQQQHRTKRGKDLFDTKSDSYRNEFTCNFTADDILNDPLPQIGESTSKVDNFDEKNFILKNLSEEEQINLAISKSLENPDALSSGMIFEDYCSADFDVPRSNNDEECIQYVDGNFDILDDSDDNDTHVVNKNDFEDEDSENGKKKPQNSCKRDVFNRKKELRDFSKRKKKPVTSDNIDLLADRLKRSNSFQDDDDPFSYSQEIKNNKNSEVNEEFMKILETNEVMKEYSVNINNNNNSNELKKEEEDESKLIRSDEQIRIIGENSKSGKEENSYRLIGIVSHLGHSSNSGHYICDVYNLKTKTWSIFDDRKVETMNENDVLYKRSKTGYILFYIHKSMETIE